HVLTWGREMGALAANEVGVRTTVVGLPAHRKTSAADTHRAASQLLSHSVDLLLFVGGDGTAVDVARAVGRELPALGVPAGVKMHSGVFAATAPVAGVVAARYLTRATPVEDREVVDMDEAALRRGELRPRVGGLLRVPQDSLIQQPKSRSSQDEGSL